MPWSLSGETKTHCHGSFQCEIYAKKSERNQSTILIYPLINFNFCFLTTRLLKGMAEEGHTPLANIMNERNKRAVALSCLNATCICLWGLEAYCCKIDFWPSIVSATLFFSWGSCQGSYQRSNPVGVLAMWIRTMLHHKYFFLLCRCLHVEQAGVLKEGIFGCVSSHIILTWHTIIWDLIDLWALPDR